MTKKNPRTQFEIRADDWIDLEQIYQWLIKNLPLKANKSIIYQLSEIYIITSSQRIIDKVNKGLGTCFSFDNLYIRRIFYINFNDKTTTLCEKLMK